jgi:hypothetical protein
VLTGARAAESALKQAAAPRLVHIATHGFFLEADIPTQPPETDRRGINLNVRIENPLLRSGLALAGANLRTDKGDDGILTAMEATGLNLWGTKLVTLSACDTGVGEVKNGEGVSGLRRAFVLAGAETLVMSLWPVSDRVTPRTNDSLLRGPETGTGAGRSAAADAARHDQAKGAAAPLLLGQFHSIRRVGQPGWQTLGECPLNLCGKGNGMSGRISSPLCCGILRQSNIRLASVLLGVLSASLFCVESGHRL